MSAGQWPDGKEGREVLLGSHINRLFHLQRCATVCVTEVDELGGWESNGACSRGEEMAKSTVHLFQKC